MDMYNPNLLTNQAISEMSEKERDLFIRTLHDEKKVSIAPFLFYTLGKEAFTFLDLFAGKTIKIPSQKELLRIFNQVIIYNYLEARDFSEASISNASAIFGKKKPQILSIIKHYSNMSDHLKEPVLEAVTNEDDDTEK